MKNPKHEHGEAFCLMKYQSKDGRTVEWIWNSQDGVTPFCILAKDGETELRHVEFERDEYRPDHTLQPGDRYFGPMTQEAAEGYAEKHIERFKGTRYEVEPEAEEWTKQEIVKDLFRDPCPDLLTKEAETAPITKGESKTVTLTKADMNRLCQLIEEFIPQDHGFIVFAFPTGDAENRRMRYASSAKRKEAVAALKEWMIQRGFDEDWMRHKD